jgi:hypothetical protein
MRRQQLMQKWIAMRSGVDSERMRKGTCTAEDWGRISRARREIEQLPIVISDKRRRTPQSVRMACMRLRYEPAGLALAVVDYLQLMRVPGFGPQHREKEMGEITGVLQSIAGDLGVPVLALSQLNRKVEDERRRPQLSDLRESGNLEQDADAVLFIYPPPGEDDVREVIVEKQRNGRRGKVYLRWWKETQRFSDMNQDWEPRRSPIVRDGRGKVLRTGSSDWSILLAKRLINAAGERPVTLSSYQAHLIEMGAIKEKVMEPVKIAQLLSKHGFGLSEADDPIISAPVGGDVVQLPLPAKT